MSESHDHQWRVGSTALVRDSNPPCRFVFCACGATAWRQDRTLRLFDLREPESPSAKALNESEYREYQTFTMQDFESEGEPLLASIDYLTDMFDLEVENEKDKPIVITLREKQGHASEREKLPVSVKSLGTTENGTQYKP